MTVRQSINMITEREFKEDTVSFILIQNTRFQKNLRENSNIRKKPKSKKQHLYLTL